MHTIGISFIGTEPAALYELVRKVEKLLDRLTGLSDSYYRACSELERENEKPSYQKRGSLFAETIAKLEWNKFLSCLEIVQRLKDLNLSVQELELEIERLRVLDLEDDIFKHHSNEELVMLNNLVCAIRTAKRARLKLSLSKGLYELCSRGSSILAGRLKREANDYYQKLSSSQKTNDLAVEADQAEKAEAE